MRVLFFWTAASALFAKEAAALPTAPIPLKMPFTYPEAKSEPTPLESTEPAPDLAEFPTLDPAE